MDSDMYTDRIIDTIENAENEYNNGKIIFYNYNQFHLNYEGNFIIKKLDFLNKKQMGWSVGLSKDFRKLIDKADKNTKARILEAIEKITKDPMTPVGDTIKPLKENLDGVWRYRCGGSRLLYKPIANERKVVLIEYSSRGQVYKEI